MKVSRRILLYGNSMILGTLGASLVHCPQFEVTTLTPAQEQDQELAALSPDVILFDLEASHPEAAFSLLKSHPNLLLIGISPDTNLIKMWAGRQMQELSTAGLLEIINGQLKDSPVS